MGGSGMRVLIGLALLAVAACGPADFARKPVEARLGRAALEVLMSDGATCRAALVGDAPWAGTMGDCGLGFSVVPTGAGSPVRMAFDAMVAAIRAGDLVAPMADIVLTDARGRGFAFASPVPLEDEGL